MVQRVFRLAKYDPLKLLPVLALAFYLAFIPHQSYPYPVHIDEWVHLANTKALMEAGSTTFIDPFNGVGTVHHHLEAGFYVLWGPFHHLSGISWLTIFRYFPGIVFMMTVLSVYILGRRKGFGWEAALLTCLIPTTVGILGPAFMVPVAMGLLFIILSIFVALNFRSAWSYGVLFIFMCFLISMHAATAVGLAIILVPYILLNLKGGFRHSLGLILALGIPFIPFPWIFDMLDPTFKSLFTSQTLPTYVAWPQVLKEYGYLPTMLCALGTFLLIRRGGRKNYGLMLGFLALLLMLIIYIRFYHGVGIMYDRGLMYAMLMVGVVAGCGLMGVRTIRLPEKLAVRVKPAFLARNAGNVLCFAFIGVMLAIGIPAHQNTPYYHMIDGEDYQAFVWVRENVDDSHGKAILDPWKATAFTAIAEKSIHTRIHCYPKSSDKKAYEFLRSGCSDTDFLKKNGISIVYTRWQCRNPDLAEVRRNIYLLKAKGGT